MIDFASGPQPPQLVAHFVAFFQRTERRAADLHASQMAPLETLLHEHTSAASGSASTPMLAAAMRAGRIRFSDAQAARRRSARAAAADRIRGIADEDRAEQCFPFTTSFL